MKTSLQNLATGFILCLIANSGAWGGDEGFTDILDRSHTDGWKHIGKGGMEVRGGVATTESSNSPSGGLYWYAKRPFADFTLRLEFKSDTGTSNSGVFVRFPDPGGDYNVAAEKGYEIDIYGQKTGTIVFPPDRVRSSEGVSFHSGEWAELEVTVIGQKYTVKLKGQQVNAFTGKRAERGYIGLQNWKGDGEVQIRNVRIKDLQPEEGAKPDIASSGSAKTDQSCIATLAEQAPNALEWALAPLDRSTPPDIRRNLTLLREDLLDEAARHAVAGAEAYKLGQQLCNDLIDTLNERDKMLVRAGYTAAQAQANIEVTNQALEARRRFTNWPTYHREKDQREELRTQKENGATLANQRPVLEWATRSGQIRRTVDALYGEFRGEARKPMAAK